MIAFRRLRSLARPAIMPWVWCGAAGFAALLAFPPGNHLLEDEYGRPLAVVSLRGSWRPATGAAGLGGPSAGSPPLMGRRVSIATRPGGTFGGFSGFGWQPEIVRYGSEDWGVTASHFRVDYSNDSGGPAGSSRHWTFGAEVLWLAGLPLVWSVGWVAWRVTRRDDAVAAPPPR